MGRVPDYELEDVERKLENLSADESNGQRAGGGIPTAEHPLESVPWMHLQEEADPAVATSDDEDEEHHETDGVLDAFVEAFNERDLDGCLDMLSDRCEVPGLEHAEDDPSAALADLWERRPTCQLTRGHLEDEDAAVLWEVGPNAAWWRLAVMRLGLDTEGDVDEIQFDDAADLVDRAQAEPPDGQLDEGAAWQEWEDGVLDEA